MKKIFVTVISIVILALLASTGFASPTSVTFDGYWASDGYDPAFAQSQFFEAGIYRFTVDSGAWASQSYNNTNGQFWLWSLNIYWEESPGVFTDVMLGNNNTAFATAGDALSNNAGSIVIIQPADGNIWFYIDDPDSPRDNYYGQSVTASVTVVPEPVSSSLFVIGGVFFAGRCYRKRRKKNNNLIGTIKRDRI